MGQSTTLFRISASLQELAFLEVDTLQKVRNGYKAIDSVLWNGEYTPLVRTICIAVLFAWELKLLCNQL